MRNIFLILVIFLAGNTLFCQSIKFKDGKVLVDDKECLVNNTSDINNIELATIDGKQTIFLKFIRTGIGQNGGLYTKVVFVEQNKSLTSRSYIFTKKILVKKLIDNKVLVDCKINEENIGKFILKFDEKVEDGLIRY